jgi:ubiquinone biosynthesis monooxygenase Coq7
VSLGDGNFTEAKYDEAIIRPPLRVDEIRHRGGSSASRTLKATRKGLMTLHNLETMAVNIYLNQITAERSEHNRQLIAAMCNEMTHLQDFQVKLLEYGWKPGLTQWLYWIVGFVIGTWSRLRGREAVLRAGIWAEAKAVDHYGELLETIEWDDETRAILEKDRRDEQAHIERWKRLLEDRTGQARRSPNWENKSQVDRKK